MFYWTLLRRHQVQQICRILFHQPIYSAYRNKFQQQPSLTKTHTRHQVSVLAKILVILRAAKLEMHCVLNTKARMEAGQLLWRPKLPWIEQRPPLQRFKIRLGKHFELSQNTRLQTNERANDSTGIQRRAWTIFCKQVAGTNKVKMLPAVEVVGEKRTTGLVL